jgi:hypothetical protein
MAAGSRTLKLSILGDVDGLNKSLKTASGDVDTFGDKIGKTSKMIGGALAAAALAAGAYAIKIGVDGVKAAIADEKAQTQLALALKNATGATDGQVKATEQAILKMSLATGVADDALRPALARLVISTGNTAKAQDLLAIALDVSTATGKPLETVANALSKGFDGNTAALGKLGIGLSTAELKSMSFEQVQGRLSTLFGGAAAANAETYAGKIARVKTAFGEASESIGTALLPILGSLLDFINTKALPVIETFSAGFDFIKADAFSASLTKIATTLKNTVLPIFNGAKDIFNNVKDAIIGSRDQFESFFDVVAYFAPKLGKVLGTYLSAVGEIAGVVITIFAKVLGAIKPLINFAIDGINLVIRGLNLIKPGADIGSIAKIGDMPSVAGFSGTMPSGQTFNTGTTTSTIPKATVPSITGGSRSGAGVGISSGGVGGVAIASQTAAEAAAMLASNPNAGNYASSGFPGAETGATSIVNVTVTGAIDKEGTARTIVDVLNNSFYRGTGGASNLVTT